MTELSGRPLLDTKPDQALYVSRAGPHEAVWSALRRNLNVLVLGERGVGKTTFLRHLAYDLRGEGLAAAFVDGSVPEDAGDFLRFVGHRLQATPTRLPRAASAFRDFAQPEQQAGPPLIELLQELQSGLSEAVRTVVLVDEMPSAVAAHSIFGRLRDEVWQLPLTWLVGAAEKDAAAYLTPPADAFFDVVTNLRPFTQVQQSEFLRKRLGPEATPLLSLLGDASTGNPRQLLGLARRALAGKISPEAAFQTSHARLQKATVLGPSAAMLMAELESLGAVSASDKRLLSRLGWTRARASQVFKTLEEAELVVSSELKDGPGRPRKVYRLKDEGNGQ
jgi:hypothetical protein